MTRSLSDFEGLWHFLREVRHTSGESARVTGTAVFEPDEMGLRCRESGQMVLSSGQTLTAERTYFWRDGLQVYFDDGRFFHTVPAHGGEAEHWCDPDTYQVEYAFEEDMWHTVWRVEGPAKSYVMSTLYARNQDFLNTSLFKQ